MFIREKFDKAFGEGSTVNGNTRNHAHENYNKVVEAVQATECHLSIKVRWISEDKEWTDATELVVDHWYRWAVAPLEALVVKRLLELTKVNQSGLGIWSNLLMGSADRPFRSTKKYCQGPPGLIQSNLECPPVLQFGCIGLGPSKAALVVGGSH
jgi:hypothetical protein